MRLHIQKHSYILPEEILKNNRLKMYSIFKSNPEYNNRKETKDLGEN